jgi:hypothetical protein
LVPSVTQVIERAGLIEDTTWFTPESRERGRAVHKMLMYSEREGLDESSVDPRLAGYLAAYRKFVSETDLGPCDLLETPLADPVRGFAGTPDAVRAFRGVGTLFDIKTGTPGPWWAIQTSAYESLVRQHLGCGPLQRFCLQLCRDGTFRLHQHRDRNDLKIFYAALTVVQWREANQ